MNRSATRYVAQGAIGKHRDAAMARRLRLIAIHTNMPATLPDDVQKARDGGPAPAGLGEEKAAWINWTIMHGLGYASWRWRIARRRCTVSRIADRSRGVDDRPWHREHADDRTRL